MVKGFRAIDVGIPIARHVSYSIRKVPKVRCAEATSVAVFGRSLSNIRLRSFPLEQCRFSVAVLSSSVHSVVAGTRKKSLEASEVYTLVG